MQRVGEDRSGGCKGAWRFHRLKGRLWLSAALRAAGSSLPDLKRLGCISLPGLLSPITTLTGSRSGLRSGRGAQHRATGVLTTEKDRVRLGGLGESLALKTVRLRLRLKTRTRLLRDPEGARLLA